ncbi:hypothetical protein CUJ86_08470 [Methanofollis fontis]|uniref:Uncharacterized protein n=2 Tax=Methanofollis fontis TaxID=2052832 RepID=A0A483CSA8_9EURY|nr:hypothetical protein CUJ86_08470 [Methanofollis fontis]
MRDNGVQENARPTPSPTPWTGEPAGRPGSILSDQAQRFDFARDTIARESVRITSYEDDAILATVEALN